MSTKVNTVYRTNDYSKFKRLMGNRPVEEARVKKILKSIEKVGYVQSPILINEHGEVIDGQGRLEALERLGLPVDYIQVSGLSIEECIALNMYQQNWSMQNYIDSYADSGFGSYVFLQQLIKAYKGVSLRVIYNALTGKAETDNPGIKRGTFQCDVEDYNSAVRILEYEQQFRPFLKRIRGCTDYYYIALRFCYEHPDVDNDRMLEKIAMLQAELIPASNVDQAFETLEKIYNTRARNKVYLATEYKKYLDSKYSWYRKKWMTNK